MLQQTIQLATKIKEDCVVTSTEDCCDKKFSLSSASQQDFVMTKKKFVATTDPWYYEKLCRDRRN